MPVLPRPLRSGSRPFTPFVRRAVPNLWDGVAFIIIFGLLVAIVYGSRGMSAPMPQTDVEPITLNYASLPYYALRTTLRMFIAIAVSLVFTFVYATAAAKSRRAEMVLIPILDVLQSVPVLGFLSFTVTFFLGLFPGNVLGAECAAIFAIFTSQAWNMAFSLYQSLRSVPADLTEVARGFGLTPWQRYWRLEAPFAVPSLVWNTMMSMSGGWFFVVASEAIAVGDKTVKLPGIGAYLATAIDRGRVDAVLAAVATMTVVILVYDQLLFRPVVAWAAKFRVELTASQTRERSWVHDLFQRTRWLRAIVRPIGRMTSAIARLRLAGPARPTRTRPSNARVSLLLDIAWFVLVGALTLWCGYLVVQFVTSSLDWGKVGRALVLTGFTMVRVVLLLALASLLWVPLGVWIGLRPRIAEKVQPLAQFLAAFPANVTFPIAVLAIVTFDLDPDIWLSFLIVFGTQWYIAFNVIAGASAFPNDLREAAASFHVRGWRWWRQVILPGILPYYFTGALTASGGSWNAAIVAEYVKWKDHTESAHGIGAYIAKATERGDYPRIVLGVATMSLFVIVLNRLVWRPLYGFVERRLRVS